MPHGFRRAGWAAGIILLAFLSWHFLGGDGVDRSRVYKIAYGNDAPFHFKGPDGLPTGLAVEIVNAAARAKQIRLEWVEAKTAGAPTPVAMRVLVTLRPTLSKSTHVTEPYLQNGTVFIVASNAPTRGVRDLEGRRISFLNYGIHRTNLAALLQTMKPLPVDSSREALEKVLSGLADAAYLSDYAVEPVLLEGKLPFPLRVFPSTAPPGRMGIGSSLEYARVADTLREGIKVLVLEGQMGPIVDRWGFFPNLTSDHYEDLLKERRKVIVLNLGIILLIVSISVSLFFLYRLNRQALLMRQAGETKAAILNALLAHIALIDPEGVILSVNEAWRRFARGNALRAPDFGVGENYLKVCESSRSDYAESSKAAGDGIRGVLQGEASEFAMEYPCHSPTEQRWFRLVVTPLSGDRRAGAVVMHIDITERKKAEAIQAELTSQLIQAQKMEAIGRLAGGVAHDFNNILAAMMLHLGMLAEDRELSSEKREAIEELIQSAQQAAGLTQQLLVFSRRRVIQKKLLQVGPLIRRLLKMLRRLIGANFELIYEGRLPDSPILADETMIEQIVLNLVVNARDAMSGGGRITITSVIRSFDESDCVRNTNARVGVFMSLQIVDTGSGMDEMTRNRIFEPFFTTKEMGKGTGLGLATVYGIVKQHEGWIEVESTVGKGSIFTVYLPTADGPHESPRIPVTKPSPVLGNETILLVEDEPSVRSVMVKMLTRAGYTIFEASHGEEGLSVWQEHREEVDLLLTDMMMPGNMTGLELGKELQRQRPSLRVLIMSGYSLELAEMDVESSRSMRFLAKPCERNELLRVVRECLDAS